MFCNFWLDRSPTPLQLTLGLLALEELCGHSVHHVLSLKLKLPLSWRVITKLFSSDIGIDSEAESPPLSPAAEHPRLEESWVDSHRESSSEVESYRTKTGSDSAAEEVVKLAAEIVAEKQISQYLSAGCGCDDSIVSLLPLFSVYCR